VWKATRIWARPSSTAPGWRVTSASANLRQIHLIHAEVFDELQASGFEIAAGQMGENITTSGLDLLALPTDARLHLGDAAIVVVTGPRNPCTQMELHSAGPDEGDP
jgi:MOSC domain-containing protein YiiM